MTVWEKNCSALAGIAPGMAETLSRLHSPESWQLTRSKTGLPSLAINGYTVHSRYDPVKEARRIVKASAGNAAPDVCILYGLGLGYTAEVCLELYPDADAVIIIPDCALFAEALRERDLSRLLHNKNCTFLFEAEPDHLKDILTDFRTRVHITVPLRGIVDNYPDYFREIDRVIDTIRSRADINRNTLIRFGKSWVRNLITNIPHLSSACGVEEAKERFSGHPALLCAAGPTLKKIGPRLTELQEKCVIIAVDTAARFCLDHGVEPDFLVVVDPQYWNSCHLRRISLTKTLLVSDSSTHPLVFRYVNRPLLLCSSPFPLGRHFESWFGAPDTLGAGGSVATTAWDLARYIGCTDIYCAGLDLGFPGRETHFRGSFFEETSHVHSRRTAPAETVLFRYLNSAGPFPVPNYDGGDTVTDRRMIIYKAWFEEQAARNEIRCYTLDPESVRIEGFTIAKMGDIAGRNRLRHEIDSVIGKIGKKIESKAASRASSVKKWKENLVSELRKFRSTVLHASHAAYKAAEIVRKGGNAAAPLALLDQLDQSILASPVRNIPGFLLQKVSDEVRESAPGKEGISPAVENSARLYNELLESVDYHLALLNRVF